MTADALIASLDRLDRLVRDKPLVDVVIPGRPVGAARPRVVRTSGGGMRAFMPDKSIAWEESARQILLAAWIADDVFRRPHPGLVMVDVLALQHRPARLGGPVKRKGQSNPRERFPAGSKPDLDNVVKLVMDAVVKAAIIPDDTRVAEIRARRLWTAIDVDGVPVEGEGVEVRVVDLGMVG